MSDSGRMPAHIARRRAVALAGHQGDEPAVRAGLTDEDATVRATALGALVRLECISEAEIKTCAADADPIVRRRAAEVAPAVAPASAHRVLRALLADRDATVIEVAAWAAGEVAEPDATTVRVLCALATTHDD